MEDWILHSTTIIFSFVCVTTWHSQPPQIPLPHNNTGHCRANTTSTHPLAHKTQFKKKTIKQTIIIIIPIIPPKSIQVMPIFCLWGVRPCQARLRWEGVSVNQTQKTGLAIQSKAPCTSRPGTMHIIYYDRTIALFECSVVCKLIHNTKLLPQINIWIILQGCCVLNCVRAMLLLCYTMLYYTILCCAMLCYAVWLAQHIIIIIMTLLQCDIPWGLQLWD
jgi:hypothetical protein